MVQNMIVIEPNETHRMSSEINRHSTIIISYGYNFTVNECMAIEPPVSYGISESAIYLQGAIEVLFISCKQQDK
jgi:hypothetical protein